MGHNRSGPLRKEARGRAKVIVGESESDNSEDGGRASKAESPSE